MTTQEDTTAAPASIGDVLGSIERANAPCGQAWPWFDLYLPEDSWAENPQRCKKAGIPDGLAFAIKPELAIVQVRPLASLGIRFLWVGADVGQRRAARQHP